MKQALWIIVAMLLIISAVGAQQTISKSSPARKPEAAAQHVEKAAGLPANPSHPDSLSVTPREGESKRAQLESSVFRREKPVNYVSSGRRDPFRALIVDEKKRGGEEIQTDLLRVDGATLTGVVWAEGRYLALVKDKDGTNFFLHEGDPVYQGRVTLVTQSQTSFEISDFGDYQKVVLKVSAKDKDKDKGKEKG